MDAVSKIGSPRVRVPHSASLSGGMSLKSLFNGGRVFNTDDCLCVNWTSDASYTFSRHRSNCERCDPVDILPINLPDYFAQRSKGAVFSDCKKYRYFLWRVFNPKGKIANFIGLNPSTADEINDDPTLRRCISFAKSWGYGVVFMTNIFALRSTDPKGLLSVSDPIGKANDLWMNAVTAESDLVVACWGVHGSFLNRGHIVLSSFSKNVFHLGLTRDSHPRHPLYLKKDTKPIPFNAKVGQQSL